MGDDEDEWENEAGNVRPSLPTASTCKVSPAGAKIAVAKAPNGFDKLDPGPGHYPVHHTEEGYHWGKPHVIQMLRDFSVKWADLRAKAPFSDRPGSFRFGLGDVWAPAGHLSHKDGLSVDIFMFRNDGLEQRMLKHGERKVHLVDKNGNQTTGECEDGKVPITVNTPVGGADHAAYDRDITRELIQCVIEHCRIADLNKKKDPEEEKARLEYNRYASLERIIVNDKHIIKFFHEEYKQKLTRMQINDDAVLNEHDVDEIVDKKPTGRKVRKIFWVHHDHVHFRFF